MSAFFPEADTITTPPISRHIPIAFLRWSQSLQKVGQVIPAVTVPVALAAFQSAVQDRWRAISAHRASADFFAISARHFATQSLSVIPTAWLNALLALHSISQVAKAFL